MKFLSLSRPWPWAIFDLPEPQAKRIENRTWKPHANVIGKLIALHASNTWDPGALDFWSRLGITGWPSSDADYPKGVLYGVVRIVHYGSHPTSFDGTQRHWYMGDHDGRNADGQSVYGWKLADVFKLPSAIPMKGGQGLRNLDFAIATRVKRQLADAGRATL